MTVHDSSLLLLAFGAVVLVPMMVASVCRWFANYGPLVGLVAVVVYGGGAYLVVGMVS